jgi:hypothetical protein
MSCYLVQEIDGTSRFTLEDGSGSLLLEFCPPTPPTGGDQHKGGRELARRKHRQMVDEEDLLAVLLNEL